jgi:hypothetical protein
LTLLIEASGQKESDEQAVQLIVGYSGLVPLDDTSVRHQREVIFKKRTKLVLLIGELLVIVGHIVHGVGPGILL